MLALALALVALPLAACGASKKLVDHSNSPYGPRNSPAAVSRCMRANGVSGFPDPSAAPGGGVGFPGGLMQSSTGELVVDGHPFAGPAVTHAEQVCKEYLPAGAGPPPQPSAAEKARLLADAHCMRAHGLPSFPDPDFSAGGSSPLPVSLNPQSPAFEHAMSACHIQNFQTGP